MGSASDLKELSRELSSMVFKVPKGKKTRPRDRLRKGSHPG